MVVKRIAQCTTTHLGHELWMDLFEVPHGINNLKELHAAGISDMAKQDRKFRIVDIIEGDTDV